MKIDDVVERLIGEGLGAQREELDRIIRKAIWYTYINCERIAASKKFSFGSTIEKAIRDQKERVFKEEP